MARYYILTTDGSEWRGPWDEEFVRQLVADGRLLPGHAVLGAWPNAIPIQAAQVPERPRRSFVADVIEGIAIGGGAVAAVALVAKGIAWVMEDPERRAIRESAERHERRGAFVRADLPGWPRPPTIRGHIPDVHAEYRQRTVIEEYENERSVERSHARRQHHAFATHAAQSRRVRYTQVIVARGRGGRA